MSKSVDEVQKGSCHLVTFAFSRYAWQGVFFLVVFFFFLRRGRGCVLRGVVGGEGTRRG